MLFIRRGCGIHVVRARAAGGEAAGGAGGGRPLEGLEEGGRWRAGGKRRATGAGGVKAGLLAGRRVCHSAGMSIFDDLGAEQERLEKILSGLDEGQWASASGARGW